MVSMSQLSTKFFLLLIFVSITLALEVSNPYGLLFSPSYDGSSYISFSDLDGKIVVFSFKNQSFRRLNIDISNKPYAVYNGRLFVFDNNKRRLFIYDLINGGARYFDLNESFTRLWVNGNNVYLMNNDGVYIYTFSYTYDKIDNVAYFNGHINELYFSPIVYATHDNGIVIFRDEYLHDPSFINIGQLSSRLVMFKYNGVKYYAIGDVGGHVFVIDDNYHLINDLFIGGYVFDPGLLFGVPVFPTSNGDIWMITPYNATKIGHVRANLFHNPTNVGNLLLFTTSDSIIAIRPFSVAFEKVNDDNIIYSLSDPSHTSLYIFTSKGVFTLSNFRGCFISSPSSDVIEAGNLPLIIKGTAYAPDAEIPSVYVRVNNGAWMRATWKGHNWEFYVDSSSLSYGDNTIQCYVESSIKEVKPVEMVHILKSPNAPKADFNVTVSKLKVKPGEIVRVYVYSNNGVPVDNFNVDVNGKTIKRSRYIGLRFESPGKYTVRISKEGFNDYYFTVEVEGISLLLIIAAVILLVIIIIGAIYLYYSYIKK